MPKKRLDLRMDPALVAAIDQARGAASRTAWIEAACRLGLVAVPSEPLPPPVESPRPARPTMDLIVTTRGADGPRVVAPRWKGSKVR